MWDFEQGSWFEGRSQGIVRVITLADSESLKWRPYPGHRLSSYPATLRWQYLSAESALANFWMMIRRSTPMSKCWLGTFVPNIRWSSSQDILAGDSRDIPSLAGSRLPV